MTSHKASTPKGKYYLTHCYAHDRSSPNHAKASLIIEASINGLIKACLSHQNLSEYYSVMTGRRVKKPLTSAEAAEICTFCEESVAIEKLLPTSHSIIEAFQSAKNHSIVNGDVFDCLLAHTAKGIADTIWTENTQHFKEYTFLTVENPLKWTWKEKK